MNEHLNLAEILKDCPKGTKLYTSLAGEVEFVEIDMDNDIVTISKTAGVTSFNKTGRYYTSGECLLFPSKDQRDWSKFKPKEKKFDPKTLKSFDKVLVKLCNDSVWGCTLFSHYVNNSFDDCPYYVCINIRYKYCIPYNEETKHLLGTREDCPKYYKWWEE